MGYLLGLFLMLVVLFFCGEDVSWTILGGRR